MNYPALSRLRTSDTILNKTRCTRLILVLAAIVVGSAFVPVAATAGPLSGLQRLFKDWGLFQGLQISGTNNFTFQENLVEGSAAAFEGQRWDTDNFMAQNSLSVEGPIWKNFQFKADFSASGYGPSYNRFVAGWMGKDTAIYYGDLNIDLSGNQFASFSKAVKGWQLDQKIGDGLARAFYSKEKAITRTQSIPGNNTSGPFFLTYTPIIQGTEVVKINEQVQQFGVDYRLDYDSGQLWFETEGRPPKIIPDTATISVSYQSQSFDSNSGTLYGARVMMPLMRDRLQVGVTMLKQDRGGGGVRDTVGYQEDIFNGSGSTGPFDVNFRPIIPNGTQATYQGREQVIQQALVVLMDNVEQVEGVDYDSYRQIGRIIFRRSVPPEALVVIRYFYDMSINTTATDNSIMGLDMLYHLTPKLSLAAEYGKSDGGALSNTGDALRLNVDYQGNNIKLVGEYRDISPTFTFMDSVGFYRQDKGLDVGLNWQPMDHVSVYARRADLMTSQGYSFGYNQYGGGTNTYGLMQTRQTEADTSGLAVKSLRDDFEVRLEFPKWPTLAFQRQKMSNAGGTSGSSDYTSNNLSMNWSPANQPFTLSASLYDTNQLYQAAGTGETAGTINGSDTRQLQWSAAYRPSDKLSLSYNQGRNKSTALDGANASSSGTDQLALRWTPTRKLEFNIDRTRTNSVGSVRSNYNNYNGYNSYSNALRTLGVFPAGIGDGGGIGGGDDEEPTENRYTDDSTRLGVRFTPNQKLSLDFQLSQRKYSSGGSVGYLADSDQTTKSISAMYQLNDSTSLSAQWNNDVMAFLEEGRGTVSNDTATLGINWRKPDSKWGLSLNYSMMDGVSPTYTGYGSNQTMRIVSNSSKDLQARLSYDLSDNSSLELAGQFSDYAGGYANFKKQQLDIGYRRKISSATDLTFGYRLVRNASGMPADPRYGDTSLTGGDQNYLANTFMLTMSTQFSSGGGGGGGGMGSMGFGGSSLGNFGGYRAGSGMFGSNGSSYGGSYGSSFDRLGVFGQSGNSSSGFGNSGIFGNTGGYGSSQPQGYETFGGNFREGQSGGFTSGLGDIGGHEAGGIDSLAPGMPGAPGAEGALEIEDWYNLDDMYSIWW